MGTRVTRTELINSFMRLCSDTEAEVRTAAAHQVRCCSVSIPSFLILLFDARQVSKVCSMLTPEQIMEFLESVKTLTQDASQHVRC